MIKEKLLSQSVRMMFTSGVALSVSMLAHPVFAEDEIQRVEITGSSIKRAEKEGSLPVQVVSHEDIQKLGVTNTEQLLNTLSVNSAVGGTTSAEGAGTTTYGLSAASLRSLGSNKTLVLVNGRRLANYASDGTSVDINSIPVSMVDHVEILKDGASGVYGSDAIGGVINFIMRKNFSGFEVSGELGGTSKGGGQSTKAGLVMGFGDYEKDRYNMTMSVDVAKDDAIYGRQRSYAMNAWDEVNGLWDQSATPSGTLRTFRPTTTPNAGGVIPNTLIGLGSTIGNALDGSVTGNGGGVKSASNCTANGSAWNTNQGTCRFNPSPMVALLPEIQRANVGANFRFKLNDNHEFFFDAFASHQLTTRYLQPSPYSVSFLATDKQFQIQNVYPAIILDPSNPNYPAAYIAANRPSAAGQPVTVSYRAFDGGGRGNTDTSNQTHLTSGFKGTVFNNYDYDIAYTHNSSSVTENTLQGFQRQVDLAKLLSHNPLFNPYAATQTPALAAQIAATNYVGNMLTSTLSTDSLDGKITGEWFKVPAGTVAFAVGGSLRNENMDFNPSAAYQTGDIAGYGAQALPLTASRHSASVFGEVVVPVLKQLEADLAVRTDRYPNATSTNPKLSLRYQPLSQVLLRASYGTGFREPALVELYKQQSQATTPTFLDPVTGTRAQFTQLVGGNPNLKPEKSEQASFGLVVDATKDLSVAVDYWKIRVSDLVTALDPAFIVQQAAVGNAGYTGLVQRDSTGNITQITATAINAGGEKTDGFDVDVKWRALKSAEYGNFGVRLNGTYTHGFDLTLPDGTVQRSVATTVIQTGVDSAGHPIYNNSNAVTSTIGGVIFRWKHQLSFDWTKNAYGLTLTQNYQGGYTDNVPTGFAPNPSGQALKVGSFQTWDLQGTYTGVKNLTLRLGVKNLQDKNPPTAVTLGEYFQTGWDPSYYDPHGRFIYATATYKF